MATLLIFGFLVGLRHALEADHVAAVFSLTSRERSPREALRHGMAWGIGHAATLFVIGSLVLLLDLGVPPDIVTWLELLVGVALLALGVDVVRRLIRDRVHVHRHIHEDGGSHLHAHSHAGEAVVARPPVHNHQHVASLPLRALLIGLLHGMAGSAALVVLLASTVDSFALGIVYVSLFGFGSMVGMAALTVAIAVPLRAARNRLGWLQNGVQAVVGSLTIGLGAVLVVQTWSLLASRPPTL
jgi:high-affinity nickel permease